jgi:uncharacterized protein YqhQ
LPKQGYLTRGNRILITMSDTREKENTSTCNPDTCGCAADGRDTSLYGGQAVLEGVLMKGKNRAVVACRNYKGEIVSKVLFDDPENKSASGIRRIPFLRGFMILWDSLSLGLKALTWSADIAMEEEVAKKKESEAASEGDAV